MSTAGILILLLIAFFVLHRWYIRPHGSARRFDVAAAPKPVPGEHQGATGREPDPLADGEGAPGGHPADGGGGPMGGGGGSGGGGSSGTIGDGSGNGSGSGNGGGSGSGSSGGSGDGD